MVCLDTDFLVGLLRGIPEAAHKLETLEAQGTPLATTPVNAVELFKGAALSARPRMNENQVRRILKRLALLTFDEQAAREAGNVLARLKRLGRASGTIDSIIAGIVLRHDETLITRNQRHFAPVEGLRLEGW